jgi:hypothetical protein
MTVLAFTSLDEGKQVSVNHILVYNAFVLEMHTSSNQRTSVSSPARVQGAAATAHRAPHFFLKKAPLVLVPIGGVLKSSRSNKHLLHAALTFLWLVYILQNKTVANHPNNRKSTSNS